MNNTDGGKNNNYFESVEKNEVKQKCFDKTCKVENNLSLKKNKGKNI